MPECGNVQSVRANQPCESGPSPTELGQQLSFGAEKVVQSLGDPAARTATRRGGQQLLEQGTAMLRQIGDGPGSVELASGLRAMEAALARLAPDEATETLPSRPMNARQQRLANTAQRSVNIGTRAMVRSQDPEDFANVVAGDMSDRHLRALSQLDTDDLRATLRENGFGIPQTERAIHRLKEKIAGKYQRVIQDRALTAMQSSAARLERAMQPGSAESDQLLGALLSGQGEELLEQFELAGADASQLRRVLESAGSQRGQATYAQLRPLVRDGLHAIVENLHEQIDTVSEWDDEDLYQRAAASESFSQVADGVRRRWSINGVVGQAVGQDITNARARNELEHQIFNGVFIAAGAIASACTGGLAGVAITAGGAMIREGTAVQGAWAAADMDLAAASAGVGSTEDAVESRDRARVATGAAAGSMALELGAAGVMGPVHHRLQHALGNAAGNMATAAIEGGIAVGIEEAKHFGEGVANGGDHH